MVEAKEGIEVHLEGKCMTEGLTTGREEKGKALWREDQGNFTIQEAKGQRNVSVWSKRDWMRQVG